MLGSLLGEEDQWEINQNKLKLIKSDTIKESTPDETKGADSMKKYCYRRKDGRWQYSRQEHGYRFYAIASTYRELLARIPNIKPKKVLKVIHVYESYQANSFLQYYQFFIDNYVRNKKISKSTIDDWQRQFKNDITPHFRFVKLEDLTAERIQNFIDGIKQERKQEMIYQRIVKVLNKAYSTGKMRRNITLGIEKPKRQNVKEVPPLTLHEQIQFLKEVKKTQIYAFAIFSIIVGSRREETLRFNFTEDVDEKKLTIHIKGTKTKNADRQVKVTRQFIEFLKAHLPKGRFKFTGNYYTHIIGDIMKKIKVKGGCLHALRHTCSANLYFLGANDKYRQMQLGHASIVTTNDIYTNIKENITPRALRLIYGSLYPQFD